MPGAKAYRLEGSSMFPVFRPGELALAARGTRNPERRLRPGDCAVYELEGRTLLHRAVKTGPEGAWFADDAGLLQPHFVPWKDVRGKVLSRNPLAGGFCGYIYSKLRRLVWANLVTSVGPSHRRKPVSSPRRNLDPGFRRGDEPAST